MDLRIFTEPQQGATYDDLLAVAQATERFGFDGFFRSDHYLVMGDSDGLPGPTDAWTTLAGLARETGLAGQAGQRCPGVGRAGQPVGVPHHQVVVGSEEPVEAEP